MWATWTDISEFTQKRNLMCVPTVERDSTRHPLCRTTKKSTPRTSLASVLNAQRSSKLAEFCWSIYELFTSTQLRVLPRLVLPCKHEMILSNCKSPGNQQQCAVLVQEICKPGGSQNWRKSVDQMLLLRSEISWNCIMILCILCHVCIIQHSGLWQSIFVQASVTEPHDRGSWWTGDLSLQVSESLQSHDCVKTRLLFSRLGISWIWYFMIFCVPVLTGFSNMQVLWSAFQLVWTVESTRLQVEWAREL